MKKIISIILTAVILVSLFSLTAYAQSSETVISETTEYFEDGSSITTTVTQITSNDLTRATKTITGSKTKTVKNSDGDVLYKFKVTGTFTVNEGVSSTCTAVSCSASNLASGWSLASSTKSKSGNKATATGVFEYTVLFITTITQETTATLTCDKNGNLS